MILSDASILRRLAMNKPDDADKMLAIQPFDIQALQGASYDLRLAEIMMEPSVSYETHHDGQVWLTPHGCCLASTLEYVRIPLDCVGRVEGKSSIGRQHVVIHCTAGWIDPGFQGNITLEIVNHNPRHGFVLKPGMYIAQLTLLQLDRVTTRPYKGKYQGDIGAQGAKP